MRKALVLITLLLTPLLVTSSSPHYYLTYQVYFSINSFIKENYTATITLYIDNYSKNYVTFTVVGTGDLYQFAQETHFNISKVILMEAYNGTYTRPIGLGEGFPMLNETELHSLRSGKGIMQGVYYNVSNATIVINGVEYQTYKIYGSKSEAGASGEVCIWINKSNGVMVKLVEKANSVLGSIYIKVILVKSSLPQKKESVTTTTTMTTTTISSITKPTSKPGNPYVLLAILAVIVATIVLVLKLRK